LYSKLDRIDEGVSFRREVAHVVFPSCGAAMIAREEADANAMSNFVGIEGRGRITDEFCRVAKD